MKKLEYAWIEKVWLFDSEEAWLEYQADRARVKKTPLVVDRVTYEDGAVMVRVREPYNGSRMLLE